MRNIISHNCIGRGLFAKHFKKCLVNQVDGFEFTQYETKVTQKWDKEKNDKEVGVFAIKTVWDKAGNESRKLLDVKMRKKTLAIGILNRLGKSRFIYLPDKFT